MNKRIKIGITIGDPSGIGPEVVVKSLENFKQPKDSIIYIFGDEAVLIKSGLRKDKGKMKLVDLRKINKSELKFGILSKKFGQASLAYLKEAVSFLKRGEINCLITAPVNKEAINLGKVKFSGHTEFLASAFGVKNTVMMFVSDRLKLSLVTRHLALNKVTKYLNKNIIFSTLLLTRHALKSYFGIKNPKLVVLGLNPHASEDGLMGSEEERMIKPAIKKFRKITKAVCGPLPPDTVFERVLNREFDAAICMYHDQGLIPFKIFSFNKGVNLTLGLPFIRTSCVHGTAFEIAGKNKANHHSMLEAIRLAYRLTKNKLKH